MASDKVKEVNDKSFNDEVIKSDKLTLVDFWAPWCMPCRAIAPVIDELADTYDGKVKFTKLNVDDNPMTASSYGVRGIPTIILYKNGAVVDQVVGAVPKAELEKTIGRSL
jgi:thioredoxin 1